MDIKLMKAGSVDGPTLEGFEVDIFVGLTRREYYLITG